MWFSKLDLQEVRAGGEVIREITHSWANPPTTTTTLETGPTLLRHRVAAKG